MCDDKKVNISKVAKVVKDINYFMLLPVTEEANLLVTEQFILKLGEKQFWKIQCKLEVKDLGIWLCKVEGDWCAADGSDIESVKRMYFSNINATGSELLHNTDLVQKGYVALFSDGKEYFGVQSAYLDMIPGGTPTVKKLSMTAPFVVDDVHVMAPVDLNAEKLQCPYLRSLVGA